MAAFFSNECQDPTADMVEKFLSGGMPPPGGRGMGGPPRDEDGGPPGGGPPGGGPPSWWWNRKKAKWDCVDKIADEVSVSRGILDFVFL